MIDEFSDVITEVRKSFDAIHYDRPAPRRRSPVRRLGWALALVAGTMLAVNAWGVGDGVAWAAVARPLTAAEQDLLDTECLREVKDSPEPLTSLPDLVASEDRGYLTSATYASGDWFFTCIVQSPVRYEDSLPFVAMQWSNIDELPEGEEPLKFATLGQSPDPVDGPDFIDPTTFITGTVGSGVQRVTITVPDLGEVEATVANGWFTAWWPSRHPFQVHAIGPNGEPIATFDVP
ncbi:MAG TPA: DUF3325 domain-containing protein [Acidimicrobiia bacterium]|nr:DUF3325 domain-containing protein [Acidimicrobiia bacterium]